MPNAANHTKDFVKNAKVKDLDQSTRFIDLAFIDIFKHWQIVTATNNFKPIA